MLRSSSLTTLTVPPSKSRPRSRRTPSRANSRCETSRLRDGVAALDQGDPDPQRRRQPARLAAEGRAAGAGGPQGPRALRHHRQPHRRPSAAAANTNQLPAAAPAALPPLQGERTWSPPKPGHRKAPSLKPPAGFVPISVEPPGDADAVPVETLPSPKGAPPPPSVCASTRPGRRRRRRTRGGGAAPPSDASPEHAARSAADYHDAVEEHAQAARARACGGGGRLARKRAAPPSWPRPTDDAAASAAGARARRRGGGRRAGTRLGISRRRRRCESALQARNTAPAAVEGPAAVAAAR